MTSRSAGEASTFGLLPGASLPIDDTFCDRLLEGRTAAVIPDTAADPRTSDLLAAPRLLVETLPELVEPLRAHLARYRLRARAT